MAIDFSKVTDLELMQELQRRMNDVECAADSAWFTNQWSGKVMIYGVLNDGEDNVCQPTFEFDEKTGKLTDVCNDMCAGDFWEQLDNFLDNADYSDCVDVARQALNRTC